MKSSGKLWRSFQVKNKVLQQDYKGEACVNTTSVVKINWEGSSSPEEHTTWDEQAASTSQASGYGPKLPSVAVLSLEGQLGHAPEGIDSEPKLSPWTC